MTADMFYSDQAIIVYELIIIFLLSYFVGKLRKQKKTLQKKGQDIEQQSREALLKQQLYNNHRR